MTSTLSSDRQLLAPDDSAAKATGTPKPAVPPGVWTVSIVVVVGAFMTQLDAAIVNLGLANIAAKLHAPLQTTQWIVSGYLLGLVIGLPLASWMSRRVGPGRLWLGALTAFTLFSAMCALSPNIQVLIAARLLQGVAGGLLLPAGQTVIAQAAGRELMGRVMSVVGSSLVLAPALGPILGGWVLQDLSWPWLFLINLPVGAVALWLGLRIIPRGTRADTSRFDSVGFALIGVALPLIAYAVRRLGQHSELSIISFYGPLLVGAVLLAIFVWRGRRVAEPLLKVRLFSDPQFAAASGLSFLVGMVEFGALVAWPLYFLVGRGYGLERTGLAMLGFAVGSTALIVSGRLTDRFGSGPVCLFGTLVMAVASASAALTDQGSSVLILEASLVLLGVGTAFSVVPAMTAAYTAVTPPDIPDAVTLNNILLRLGGAVGTSLMVAIIGNQLLHAKVNLGYFQAAFWVMSVLSVLSFLAAVALTVWSRPSRPALQAAPVRTSSDTRRHS
jgi:EmrB/QacA subfamily drug resistance transporter